MLAGLRGLVIYDHDGRSRRMSSGGGLTEAQWRRYEPENYFVSPELLERWVQRDLDQQDLFATARSQVMIDMLRESIFADNPADLGNYLRADEPTRKTLWRAQTQQMKLSTFAGEYFRRVGAATGTPMLLRKGNLHQLIEECDPSELNGEVREKLDELAKLFA